jgi:uroporphyrinogen-III synthase
MKPPVVLVVRRDDHFSAILRSGGCEVLNLELITTTPLEDLTALDRVSERIDDYDGLFFTSPVAAKAFVERSKAAENTFFGKVYVLGRRAKTILENAGFNVVFAEDANTAEDLIASFPEAEFAGTKLLFVRGDKSMRTIPKLLAGKAVVDEIIVYETKPLDLDDEAIGSVRKRLSDGQIEWICFFSPSAVDNFCRLFTPEILKRVKTAVIGETTGLKARDRDMRVEFISKKATAESFAAGLIGQIKNIE